MHGLEISVDAFAEPARASRNLARLHEAFLSSGSTFTLDEFSGALAPWLLHSPDPDMALTNLLRFSEASVSRTTLFNDLIRYPVFMELLLTVFGYSAYFADILVREPELFRWLILTDALTAPLNREEVRSEVDRIRRMFRDRDRRLGALKRLHRRELLRIGVQDILAKADLASVTGQLSALADVMIDAALDVANSEVQERFAAAPATPFTVIGLGKLGGNELNYSSDIDVMFVYGDEGEVRATDGTAVTHLDYFTRVAERTVQLLSQPSEEGYFYRVDTRLRPEAGAGPLARSLSSYLTHYEARGELWERQMLIKARPAAGDGSLGEAFVAKAEPFVYPRALMEDPLGSIARIKARIETSVGDEANIKLMAGGIRDIEFTVQALQLLNGGADAGVRDVNTLRAMKLLAARHLLAPEEYATLREAYVFYRMLEHRLQTMLNTQTHTVPRDERTLASLARRLGFGSTVLLDGAVRRHLVSVRGIYNKILSPGKGHAVSSVAAMTDGGMDDRTSGEIFRRLGFRDTARAVRTLRTLLFGSSLTGAVELDARSREVFRQVADVLFDDIGRTPEPDLTLGNLAALAAAQKFPGQFYAQLTDARFRKFILQTCAVSPRFVREFARTPLLLETLAGDADAFSSAPAFTCAGPMDAVALKSREELRSGVKYLLGISSFDALTRELTALADCIVSNAFNDAARTAHLATPALAVFALGKYGTGEINFDADLDMLFVTSARSAESKSRLEALAAAVVRRLTAVSDRGLLYDVDARLRPEGKNSPLVVDASSYARYLRERASLWERQSLTRLRLVCGHRGVGDSVKSDVERYVYDTPLPPDWADQIVAMRRKTETRSRTRGGDFLDIKLGAGGMVDIEFLVQMIQLKARERDLGGRSVPELLERRLLTQLRDEEADALAGTYRLYRRIETLMRLVLEERGSVLAGSEKIARVARFVDYSTADSLRTRLASAMRDTRTTFLAVSKRLAA